MRFLQDYGYRGRIYPVNPKYPEILGEKAYRSLRDIPEKVDIVDVFRKSADVMPIAEDAIRALVSLGYTTADAEKAVRAVLDGGKRGLSAPELIRAALAKIGGR